MSVVLTKECDNNEVKYIKTKYRPVGMLLKYFTL
jgi:hypothetical protein